MDKSHAQSDTYPFERGAMGRICLFNNSIIGNFIVYKDRIETVLLKLSAHPENSDWFSVIFVIVFEVKIVAEKKQTQLVMIYLFFVRFHCAQLFNCPPALPLLQRPWFHIIEHWAADVNKKVPILLVQNIKKMWHCSKKEGADGMRP